MHLCRNILLKPLRRTSTIIPLRYNTTKTSKKINALDIQLSDTEFGDRLYNPESEEGEEFIDDGEIYRGKNQGEEEEDIWFDENTDVQTIEEQMNLLKEKKLNQLRESIFADIKEEDTSKPGDDLLSLAHLSRTKVIKKEEVEQKVKDPSTIFRDLKLELKVQSLFNDIIQSHENGRMENISHKDIETKSKLEEAKERISKRLGEVKRDNPNNFYSFMSTMDEKKLSYLDKEAEVITKGSVPGSLTAPWARKSHLWNNFFEFHTQFLLADYDDDVGEVNPANDAAEEDNEEKGHNDDEGFDPDMTHITSLFEDHELPEYDEKPHFYFLQGWLTENFDYPLNAPILETKKKVGEKDEDLIPNRCKGRCMFCDPNQPSRILDPMNVPLLLNFMTSSGYIQSRRRTGMCERMQKRVARTIKHARNLGLFSYKNGGFFINLPYDSKPPRESQNTGLDDITDFDPDSLNLEYDE